MGVLISIVVVTYDDHVGLSRTVSSIVAMESKVPNFWDIFEVIVVDGFESEATGPIVARLPSRSVSIIAEPDDGIYHAMKKGAERAAGEFVWFLNGGDEGLSGISGQFLQEMSQQNVHMFGYELVNPNGSAIGVRKCRPVLSIFHALPTSHQAVLFPLKPLTSALESLDFARYSVCLDYAMAAEIYRRGVQFERHPVILARFYLGGTSSMRRREIGRQAARVQREILGSPWPVRAVSRLAHKASFARAALRE